MSVIVPDWVKNIKIEDPIFLYFPYTGNTAFGKILSHLAVWKPGLRVEYIHQDEIFKASLYFEKYVNDAADWDNWIAYQMID